eukprot:scaffold33205_cov51-Phaeocystis_antarctica.AAC.1
MHRLLPDSRPGPSTVCTLWPGVCCIGVLKYAPVESRGERVRSESSAGSGSMGIRPLARVWSPNAVGTLSPDMSWRPEIPFRDGHGVPAEERRSRAGSAALTRDVRWALVFRGI